MHSRGKGWWKSRTGPAALSRKSPRLGSSSASGRFRALWRCAEGPSLRAVATCAKVLTKVGAAHFFVLCGAGGGAEMDPRIDDGQAFLGAVEAVVSPILEAQGLELV